MSSVVSGLRALRRVQFRASAFREYSSGMAHKNTRRGHPEAKPHVIYEQVPNPDPAAVTKAFDMLFQAMPNRPPSGKPEVEGGHWNDLPKRTKSGQQQQLPF
jgi:hypothetical protein